MTSRHGISTDEAVCKRSRETNLTLPYIMLAHGKCCITLKYTNTLNDTHLFAINSQAEAMCIVDRTDIACCSLKSYSIVPYLY